jgi:tetratricopeptide (TPR) repeat protein
LTAPPRGSGRLGEASPAPPSAPRAPRLASAAIALAILATGCASTTPRLAELVRDRAPARVELVDVPFFPQRDYQCGPAALATVLAASGRTVTPDQLVPQVYVPERRGSFAIELVAAARSHERLPYSIAPSLDDAIAQLAAGHPVLVLQNLGLGRWPLWHFAVLVGYDATANSVVLRSGTTERYVVGARRFDRFWKRADRWGLVVLEPGELPADPDLTRYLSAAAGLEAVGDARAARVSYQRARAEWPDSAWPWLGLANLSHAAGELERAQREYLEALARDPTNVAARNNLAETLVARGCTEQARREIERARELAEGTALEARVLDTAAQLAASSGSSPIADHCRDAGR